MYVALVLENSEQNLGSARLRNTSTKGRSARCPRTLYSVPHLRARDLQGLGEFASLSVRITLGAVDYGPMLIHDNES